MLRYLILVGALSSTATACGGDSVFTLIDPQDADLCLNDSDGFRVLANYGDCLAGGCVSVESTACDVVVDANVLTLFTSATLRNSNESDCPANCAPVVVECDPVALPVGEYEIRYGERTHPVTLPLTPSTLPPDGDPNAAVCFAVLTQP